VADPLKDHPALVVAGTVATGKAGPRLHERRDLCLIQVIARPGHERDAGRILGLDLPDRPNSAISVETIRVLCLRPRDWLIVTEDAEGRTGSIAVEARTRLAGHAAAIDQSHGRVVLRLEGEGARGLLQKGLDVDLHPRAFAEQAIAQTGLAGIALMVHQVTADAFDLYVARSFAASLADWLVHHGARLERAPGT
jgi:sarcosine oxidase subunit gamma